jgi:Putative auto-transporter adhesin, head GIN domain
MNTMKKIIAIVSLFILFNSCEKPADCIKSTGAIISKEFEVTSFENIYVYKGVGVVITQGPEYKVEVKTGENLMSDIEVKVENNSLQLRDNSTCNWVRDYGHTIVYVTTPTLVEIHSKTERNIVSNGILTYPTLRLFSLDTKGDGVKGAGTGDFIMQLNNNQFVVECNNVSRFYISGTTNEALLNYYDGNGRIEAQDLTVQNITVFHRGTNDMIVKPIQSITGKMVSTGNIVLKNNPPLINVQELYQGHVVYN